MSNNILTITDFDGVTKINIEVLKIAMNGQKKYLIYKNSHFESEEIFVSVTYIRQNKYYL